MTRKLIHVTTEDIQLGQRYVTGQCPIARALRREFDPVAYVQVSNYRVLIMSDGTIHDIYRAQIMSDSPIGDIHADLPRSARRFISKFDKRGDSAVSPFNFVLDV